MDGKADAMFSGHETDSATASADQLLSSLGYKPELQRNRSTFQVAFMSFVLAAVPYGVATTLYYPLVCGGPADVIWGWIAVSLIVTCVAVSLGEITSVYPTAGGVYYQAFMLAPPNFRRIAAWICGWLFVVGNISITLSVNFATALFLISCINVFENPDGTPLIEGSPYQAFLIFLALTLICNAVCALCNKWLPILDTFAIFWTFLGLIATLVTVLVIAKGGRRDAKFAFTYFEVNSGWKPGWSFFVGLLHAAYATSSTGMILSMCEEVRAPATQVPKAMVLTNLFNFAAGLVFLIPLMFVLPSLQDVIPLAQPVPFIIKSAVGNSVGTFVLLIPLLVLGFICGIGCVTATSRAIYGFARDGAVPGSNWFKVVHPKLDVPFNAMMLGMVVEIALGLLYFGSSAAFNAFSGVGVIALTAAYSVPIIVSMWEGRKTVATGSFYFGTLGWVCNVIATAWTLLVIPLFSMPTVVPVVDPSLMNYAPVVFVGFTFISLGWYIAWGRKNYKGPPT
ncbi:amino acid transporter [Xylaria nigripes]|nr:amino acid transporter [Xylaria nigripes]